MGATLAGVDWNTHPLGPVDTWPQSLRTASSIVLRSQFPMFVFWGPELIQLYNDAFVPIAGAKHPDAVGGPATETWAEVWEVIGPLLRGVLERGDATYSDDQLMLLERHGFVEETYFTFCYSPIEDESSGIGGVFCACTETTARVLADRRIRTVRALAEGTSGAQSTADAVDRALKVLGDRREDLPAVAIYTTDPDTGRSTLAASVGFPASADLLPTPVTPGEKAGGLARQISDATADPTTHHVANLADATAHLDPGPWGLTPHQAIVRGLADPTSGTAAGVLVAAVSPHLAADEPYTAFIDLIADTLGSALVDAIARQRERERLEALAELNRAKTEFFSNVSHEFRTPLTLILGPIDDARRTGSVLSGDGLEQVQRNAQRLLKLVNTLLEFSRVEAGRHVGRFDPTDLARLTEEIASAFRSAIESAGITYDVRCEPLPEPVHVDPDHWEKVVLNLVSNAFKFTDTGTISVAVRDDGGDALLEVQDTGVGISRSEQARLFERFYRGAAGDGRTHEGTGIGLALVRELVALHGGEVEVESELGHGSTFRVRVPYGRAHVRDVSDPVAEPSRGQGTPTAQREAFVSEARGWAADLPDGGPDHPADTPTVLVVDDNADMRRYLHHVLSAHWNVRTAVDGRAALEAVQDDPPDAVVTDVMMPSMDGFGLVEALRANAATRGLPIVMLSARAGEAAAGQGLDAGADDYITKPFTAQQLVARVRANLTMARLRSELSDAQARTQLLAGVSHNMLTPLALILGVLSELRGGGFEEEARLELLDIARARAEHVRLLVQQFLDHARLEAGQPVRVSDGEVDLVDAAEQAVALFSHDDVVVHSDGPVPARGDEQRLVQIVVNLVQNAIAYADGPIVVRAERRDDVARLTVTDRGPGVDTDELERIFDRFYRGATSHDRTGSGLGLHISRQLAERMRGTLRAEHAGEGTMFILELPVAADPAADLPTTGA